MTYFSSTIQVLCPSRQPPITLARGRSKGIETTLRNLDHRPTGSAAAFPDHAYQWRFQVHIIYCELRKEPERYISFHRSSCWGRPCNARSVRHRFSEHRLERIKYLNGDPHTEQCRPRHKFDPNSTMTLSSDTSTCTRKKKLANQMNCLRPKLNRTSSSVF